MRIESLVAESNPIDVAYAALQESDDRYRELAEHCRDVCWMADVPSGRLCYLNPAFESVFGLEPDLAYNDPDGWRYIAHVEDREQVQRHWEQLDWDFNGWDVEYRVVRPDGRVVWIHERAFPIRNLNDDAFRIAGISEDITERRSAEEQLNRYRSRLQDLTAELDLACENERRRIAAGLHDEVGQNLALARIQLGQLGQEVPAETRELLASTTELVQRTIAATREFIFELSPPPLYELGLWPAFDWLADKLRGQVGLHVQLEDQAADVDISQEQASLLFRVVRELLHNVVKHSGSERAVVRRFTSDGRLSIQVEDFGSGFSLPQDAATKSIGLFLTRERIRSLNGAVDVQSQPGKGTVVTVTIPLASA